MARDPKFVRMAQWHEERVVIRSECVRCGEHTLGSMVDGSLHAWQERHRCPVPAPVENKPASSKNLSRQLLPQ